MKPVKSVPARPRMDMPVKLAAARKFLADKGESIDIGYSKDECSEHIAKDLANAYSSNDSGYEMALRLNSDGWAVDRDLMDELDEFDWFAQDELKTAILKWIADNDVKPKLKPGDSTKYGIVDSVYDYMPACYMIKENGCTVSGRHLIVRFEDAEMGL